MRLKLSRYSILLVCCTLLIQSCSKQTVPQRTIWTKETANQWYEKQGWLIGANYLPKSAMNQLEMWQSDTFDTLTINKELGYAESLGMNTMRVFLHDLLYEQDAEGFYKRIDTFLTIAKRHHIKPLIVLFDSCWDPFPKLGKQHEPKPFVHNSGWVQSPGQVALKDTNSNVRLEKYVKSVIGHFAKDDRILGWDVWNEPDNMTGPSYQRFEPANKAEMVTKLLPKVFAWARAANPSQPLTSGVWAGNWSSDDKLKPIEKIQLEESDIISFHNYDKPAVLEQKIKELARYGKPMLCTEYMARPNGSTFQSSLPVAKKYKVGMINWGFVSGKSQTIYPWDSWTKQYNAEPPVWFHDIFREDGTPYKPEETEFIKAIVNKK